MQRNKIWLDLKVLNGNEIRLGRLLRLFKFLPSRTDPKQKRKKRKKRKKCKKERILWERENILSIVVIAPSTLNI